MMVNISIIITNIIDHVHRLSREHDDRGTASDRIVERLGKHARALHDMVEEGKEMISKVNRLKYRMARDQKLE